ncbi:MAG: TonB family protein [Dysgonomonas sp.]
MNNFLSHGVVPAHQPEFYEKKFVIIWCFISALHVLLVFWMIQSFNKIIPTLNQSSALHSAALQVRFLSTPIRVSATAIENSLKTSNLIAQSEPKLIATTSGKTEVLEKNQNLKSEIKSEKAILTQKTEVLPSKALANTQQGDSTHLRTENSKSNETQEKSASTSTVGGLTQKQVSHHSSQATTTTITSAESVEKTKTKNTELKAIQRRLNYPARARSLGVEGRISVQFDITSSGTVSNIQILSENPTGVFTDSVLKDMARWRYQTTGEVKNQIVSIVFKLDGRVVLDN